MLKLRLCTCWKVLSQVSRLSGLWDHAQSIWGRHLSQACRVLEQQTSRARTLPNQTKHAQSNSSDCMFTIASRFLVTPDAFLGISFLPSISLKGRTLEACGNPILHASPVHIIPLFLKTSGTLRIGTTDRTCQCRIDVNSGAHPNPKWKWEQNGFFFFWDQWQMISD